ncbi:hypothetical protein PoB_007489300 [Plakobranchus ocellatus]|uniref:Uncharacterized protein n=1 Tax=Plakobranchus ocellatus TaxID=259542 RepID=A0AAV4DVI9_9GAST|nr:hypothetical protein PoB_007489300 [Plakobranchus ocellatus]
MLTKKNHDDDGDGNDDGDGAINENDDNDYGDGFDSDYKEEEKLAHPRQDNLDFQALRQASMSGRGSRARGRKVPANLCVPPTFPDTRADDHPVGTTWLVPKPSNSSISREGPRIQC